MTGRIEGDRLACERGGRRVFEGLSFALESGAALVLHGPNGSGKSSLLRLVAGLAEPAAGTLTRNGVALADDLDGHKADLRYVGHALALKPMLTLADNLTIWAELYGVSDPAGAVRRALATVRLEPQADLAARVLSSGQQRRAALARLFLAPVSLWLLDEPTVGLDTAARALLAGLMADHLRAGGMILTATHQDLGLPEAARLDLGQFAPQYWDEEL
ncbi:heme ABC exporter ATP-binding protein CcmA [Govanella unica]|uniref:Heme ABC exporter ATP-binding protein CcmA n=1 Tax=Govanella unica TaxID=2975056 RepID=A0A9X3Z670_9PROT|nr:heme ABC exporter ATP-binding protein CcmA [Govania unica]